MSIAVKDTQLADFLWVANNLRQADREEVAAVSGRTPMQSLSYAWEFCPYMKTGFVDEVPFLIFGVGPAPRQKDTGLVWMLATNYLAAPKCRRALARHSRKWVEDMQSLYPRLTNKTDLRNTAHHRWLKWCGFSFTGIEAVGPTNAPFITFERLQCVTPEPRLK